VHLGPVVNSPFAELKAALSPDQLSLYFGSNRPDGLGQFDIWVSRRACLDCPWGQPTNLGPPINGADNGGQPSLSKDGHLLFFASNRAGGFGSEDIWMSRRADPKDDFGWGPPVNLGPEVNSPANENGPSYVTAAEGSHAHLYFSRAPELNIYFAPITRHGETRGPAILVSELSHPTAGPRSPTVRRDGRELIFWSGPGRGGLGGADLWVSTRQSIHDAWSTPTNLGAPVNSPFADLEPQLSQDGRTLLFSAAQGRGGLGLQDLWMSTRTPSGH
jgi:Tol biopolymer transport system component